MKSRSKKYLRGIEWIANNDEPDEKNPIVLANMISVLLLADMFDLLPEDVVKDILKIKENDHETI